MPHDRFIVSYTDVDRRWAKWIAFQLEQAGVPVHVEYDPGSNVVIEFDRMMSRGDRMTAVLSDQALRDPRCRGQWAAALNLDSASSARRLVPVLVEPCVPDGLLGALSAVRLYGLDREEAVSTVLSVLGLVRPEQPPAFPGRMGRQIGELLNSPPAAVASRRLEVSDGPLPRLRFLSDRARNTIGQIADASFEAGLYVRRDVEQPLLEHLRARGAQPVLVVGEPGVGKSSLLWGIASALLQDGDREVFLLEASWLRELALDGRPIVRRDVVAQAVRAAAELGRTSTVLVDTADLVVNDLPALLELAGVVDVAAAAGASVMVTTRPAEAGLLPAWDAITLGHYGTAGAESEFERAVASHCVAYSTTVRGARKMAAKLVSLVLGRGPEAHLLSRPLTMRMLFELYAPASLPGYVDVTALYQRFWRDRVESDRRTWGRQSTSDLDADLTPVVLRFAEHMLEFGIPEAPLRGIGATDDDVTALVRRGVGEVVPVAGERVFRFFHQTFFEFAAAQALWRRYGPDALKLLGGRVQDSPDDYFLLAVYEQVWLQAWRDDAALVEVSEIAENLLDTAALLPYPMRRSVLAVFALAPKISLPCHEKFGDLLHEVELPLLRDCLSLMPATSRHWTEADISTLARCADRPGTTWIAVLGVLGRLAQRDPRLAVAAVQRLNLIRRVTNVADWSSHLHGDAAELLVRAAPHVPEALVLLRHMCGDPVEARRAATVFRAIAEKSEPLSGIDFATWADEVAGDARWKLLDGTRAHAELHRRRVRLEAENGGWTRPLAELTELVGRLNGEQRIKTRDCARLAGLLLAFGEDAPLDTAAAVAAVLRPVDSRALHAELRHGRLAGFTTRCPNAMTSSWIDWLVEGLPVVRHLEAGGNRLWASTIRWTLEHADVPLSAVAMITDAAAARLPQTESPWLDENSLRRLVLRAFAGGSLAARRVLELSVDDPENILPGVTAVAVGTETDLGLLFDLLLRWRRPLHIAELLVRPEVPGEMVKARSGAILELITALRQEGSARQQQAAGILFDAALRRGAVDLPEWTDLQSWLHRTEIPDARNLLVGLVGDGLRQGRYSPRETRPVLTALLDRDRFARRELVELISGWGVADDADELLRLAFEPPVTSATLVKVSTFVRRNRRCGAHLPVSVSLRFVADFAVCLKEVSAGKCVSTALGWRGAIAELLYHAGEVEQLSLFEFLPRMEEHFAATVVLRLRPWRHPEVQQRLNEMVGWDQLGPLLRRNILLVLSRHR